MNDHVLLTGLISILYPLVLILVFIRILLRPNREASSRVAWIVVILAFPVLGIVAYVLLGETNIGLQRVKRMRKVIAGMPDVNHLAGADAANLHDDVPQNYIHLFQAGKTVNGFDPVEGNRAHLMTDSNAAIDSMVADIDAAKGHVHLLFYIWLSDNSGMKVVEALKRAAARGVNCRAMADGLGSRTMIASEHWKDMTSAGVHLAIALPVRKLLRPLKGRIDLRNHRKIVVVDNKITYCGSQNCADPAFRVKPKFAPWVDAVMRFEGPIVRQNQYLFATDWQAGTGEDIGHLLKEPIVTHGKGFPAQVIGTGPTVRNSAMPEIFETLIFGARDRLVISTPYYVPNAPMQAALCACARRGVDTTIIFPANNDSWIVGAASRSYYLDLLVAGVRIFEYVGGLLHTKSLTLDDEITLIGSANMDRRSFELNYENNILFYNNELTATVVQRQESYIANSEIVTLESVAAWNWRRRLWNNTIAMLGPVL
jgi:cardiolipin synthase